MRGGNAATVGDVVELRGFLNSRFEVMEKACTILKGAGSGAPAAPATRGRIDTLAGSAPELVLQDQRVRRSRRGVLWCAGAGQLRASPTHAKLLPHAMAEAKTNYSNNKCK